MPLTDEQHKKFMRRAIELSKQCGVIEKTGARRKASRGSGVGTGAAHAAVSLRR